MNAASYLLAIAVVGTGIFAFGPHHMAGSDRVSAEPSYVPAKVPLRAGATARLANAESSARALTAASFDAKQMPEKHRWSHVFTKAGSGPYYCVPPLHAWNDRRQTTTSLSCPGRDSNPHNLAVTDT